MIVDPKPKVSVIIPAYRTADTLARAALSALTQSEPDVEVIIVEDCSGDRTLDVARDLAASDARVSVIAQPVNGGQARALNRGIAAARGDWIATLDADDRYQPDRLRTMLGHGATHDVPMVADNQNHLDEAAGILVRTAFPTTEGGRIITLADFIAHSDTASDFSFGILKPMIRTSFIRAHSLGYREGLKLGQDFYHLMQFFAAGGRGYFVNQPFYDWTLPFGPISRAWTTTGDGAWRYDYRSTLEANRHFIEVMEKAGQPELVALLRRREREYKVMIHYIDAQKLSSQSGKKFAAAMLVARHPSTWQLLGRRVTGRLQRAIRSQVAAR